MKLWNIGSIIKDGSCLKLRSKNFFLFYLLDITDWFVCLQNVLQIKFLISVKSLILDANFLHQFAGLFHTSDSKNLATLNLMRFKPNWEAVEIEPFLATHEILLFCGWEFLNFFLTYMVEKYHTEISSDN